MDKAVEAKMMKGRVGAAMRTITDEAQRHAIFREYEALLNAHRGSNKMLMTHLQNAILPAIAMYRVLPTRGFGKTEVRRMIRKSVLDAAKPARNLFQSLGKLPFFFALFRRMCELSMDSMFGESGWDMRFKVYTPSEIRWDCHACFYCDVLKQYGMPELAPIFCESDDVMYGSIPHIKWAHKDDRARRYGVRFLFHQRAIGTTQKRRGLLWIPTTNGRSRMSSRRC